MPLKNISVFLDVNLKKIALVLCFFLPFLQLRGRSIADFIISFIAISFLLHSVFKKKYDQFLHGWFPLALGLWVVMIISSLLDQSLHAVLQALVIVRFFVFAKALEEWLLDTEKDRKILGFAVTLAGLWVLEQCWQQYVLGYNLWGDPRWRDGALTGPFADPRAGPALLFIMFPGLMIYPMRMVQNKAWSKKIIALGMMSFLLVTMVIIGQRMPTLLVFFGFLVCAILIKTTRIPVVLSILAGFAGLAMLPILSPPAYNKLVLRFLEQIKDFPHSPYGQIYIRAMNMLHAHPIFGLGFDGFRRYCTETTYVYGVPQFARFMAGQNPADGCNIHPHNFYLEIATTAGFTGLLLFVAIVLVWMKNFLVTALATQNLMLSMLFITLCMLFWPMASTSSFFTERTAGWVFLLVGWGLAIVKSSHNTGQTSLPVGRSQTV